MKHLIFLFLVPAFIFCQDSKSIEATYKIGAPYPHVFNTEFHKFFENDGNIISLKVMRGKAGKKREYVIQRFDASSLQYKSSNNYSNLPIGHVFEGIYQIKERLYFFYSIWDESKEVVQLFVKEINFNSGKMIAQGRHIITYNQKAPGKLDQKSRLKIKENGKFYLQKSADESKLLIEYRTNPEKRNNDISYEVIGFHVFDNELSSIWNKELKMPYTDKKMINLDYAVDSYGNSYLLSRIFKDNTTNLLKKDGSINIHLELFKIDAKTKALSGPFEIKVNGSVGRVELTEGAKGQMTCTGFYYNDKNNYYAKGFFAAVLDESSRLLFAQSYEIPLDVTNQYISQKQKARNLKRKGNDKKEGFFGLRLEQVIPKSDGSLLIIGEQFDMNSSTTLDANGGSSNTTWTQHYDNVLVSKINPDGSLGWMKLLPKKQEAGEGKNGMGIRYFTRKNAHYFLFLGNRNNLELSVDEEPEDVTDIDRERHLVVYKITDEGTVSKFPVFNPTQIKELKNKPIFNFVVDHVINISDDEFVVEFYKRKKEDVLVKIKLN